MRGQADMPVQSLLDGLGQVPPTQPELRAVLATTAARWLLDAGESARASDLLSHALDLQPDLRPAMRLLQRLDAVRRDVRGAVTHLDQEIRATRHPREAAALYRERGQLVEAHFRDLGAAQQCYQAALKATPRDLAVLRSVERVSLARGDVFWLIANLEAQLEVLHDPGAAAGVLRDLALLETRRGGDPWLAGDLLVAALGELPGHLGLIADLFRVSEHAGDAELMLLALELEARAQPGPHRAAPLARAALTLRELKDRAGAIALLHAAAKADPAAFSLWRTLEELAMASSQYELALHAIAGQLRALDDGADAGHRAELYYRAGKLALFRLDRVTEGLAAMRSAIRLMPGHVPALEDAGRYLSSGGQWAQLLELAKLEIDLAPRAGLTARELALAHLRAGQVLEEHLRELEGARKYYEDAARIAPTYRPAHDRLERVLHQLRRIDELRDYYRAELGRAQAAPRRVFLLSLLGQLHARDADPKEAINYLVAVLKEQPEHLPSLQQLARLLDRAGRREDLLRVTQQEIRLTMSPVRRAKLLHRSGEIALAIGDDARALAAFHEALDNVDDHAPTLQALESLLRRRDEPLPLLDLLRKRLLYTTDRAQQVSLRLEVAGLLATRLDRRDEALRELLQLLDRWPRHLPALHAAESVATQLGRWDTLVDLLDRHVTAVTGPRTRALLLHRSAQVRSGRLGDADGAIRDLTRALQLWPQLGVARALLLGLYERLGLTRQLQAFAEEGLTRERGADDRRAMALQLAELTPRAVVAVQYLGAVAEARPEDAVTQLRLARAAHDARRPSREAGALEAAARAIASGGADADRDLLALRCLAGRAAESAGQLDQADELYAQVLDADPGHALARRGRLRLKERRKAVALARSAADLEATADGTNVPAEKAAYLTIAAELHERRNEITTAMRAVNQALRACPGYLPALHCRARLLQLLGSPAHVDDALQTYDELHDRLTRPAFRTAALCRAGTLALIKGERAEPNPRAWSLFARALDTDPSCDPGFRGLQRVRDAHGPKGAPRLARVMERRMEALREAGRLDAAALRQIVGLLVISDGPGPAAAVMNAGLPHVDEHPGLHADLAQLYAMLERWTEVVPELEAALALEFSPERRAALHYYLGDTLDRAGDRQAAVGHYVAAAKAGVYVQHALAAAERLTDGIDDLARRVEVLELLVEHGDRKQRVASLQRLAELHRGPLGQPDVAVERMRELLLLYPTDVDVVLQLRRLLTQLDRADEGRAALLAAIAHHRAWLRSQGLRHESDERAVAVDAVVGLRQLFRALGQRDGFYLSTAVLDAVDPERLVGHRRTDDLVSEPWALPHAQEGRPFDLLVGDLPHLHALDLLREGVFFLDEIPGTPPPTIDLSPRSSLPGTSGAAIVVRGLADAMGMPQPFAFLNSAADQTAVARLGPSPSLILGRRTNASPFTPASRTRIGRALFRLSTGGDFIHRNASLEQLTGLLVGLCRGAGVAVEPAHAYDEAFARAVEAAMPQTRAAKDLGAVAQAFADNVDGFDPAALRAALVMAEDRAGAVCAADPRPALAELEKAGALQSARGTALVSYLMSEDHLTLRRTLGYDADFELEAIDEVADG